MHSTPSRKPAILKPNIGSDGSKNSNRNVFGQTVVKIMSGMSDEEKNVLCIDSDLEGSVGFKHIRAAHPDLYLKVVSWNVVTSRHVRDSV